jgi:hypothetical protein
MRQNAGRLGDVQKVDLGPKEIKAERPLNALMEEEFTLAAG